MKAFLDIEAQRRITGRVVVALLWALTLTVLASRLALHAPWLGMTVAAAGFAAVGSASGGLAGVASRTTLGLALVAEVSMLVAAFAGHAWQSDMHMAYFAALAILAGFCDWRIIAAAAGAVAVHHLALNFLLPSAVFTGSAGLSRVMVHAVILVVEAGVLIAMTANLDRLFKALEANAAEARAAAAKAEQATASAAQAHDAQDRLEAERSVERHQVEVEQGAVVESLGEALSALSRGDLAYRLTSPFPGAYERLRADFNAAIGQLQDTLKAVLTTADGLKVGANEIAQASDDLSRRTEQQAASLEETAAALEELTATVRQAADGAKQASDLVSTTRGEAEHSGQVVRSAVAAMSEIEKSSSQIARIIGVIDEIAFQTNLLALNAGVEAARAGESGRGFAVVAQEVRALAGRSADAAKEIKTLISASTTQVDEGVRLVGDTGEALHRIVERVGEIDTLVGRIAASSQEQASGLGQVNVAVGHMDQVTQQNAAMVEQSTAASHSLQAEAASLARLVDRFQVGQVSGRAEPARATPPAPAPAAAPPQPARARAPAPRVQGANALATDGWEEF